MSRIVIPHAVVRKPRTFYFVDAKGNLGAAPMGGKGLREILIPHAVVRKPRMFYFVDAKGNLCETPMKARRG